MQDAQRWRGGVGRQSPDAKCRKNVSGQRWEAWNAGPQGCERRERRCDGLIRGRWGCRAAWALRRGRRGRGLSDFAEWRAPGARALGRSVSQTRGGVDGGRQRGHAVRQRGRLDRVGGRGRAEAEAWAVARAALAPRACHAGHRRGQAVCRHVGEGVEDGVAVDRRRTVDRGRRVEGSLLSWEGASCRGQSMGVDRGVSPRHQRER